MFPVSEKRMDFYQHRSKTARYLTLWSYLGIAYLGFYFVSNHFWPERYVYTILFGLLGAFYFLFWLIRAEVEGLHKRIDVIQAEDINNLKESITVLNALKMEPSE